MITVLLAPFITQSVHYKTKYNLCSRNNQHYALNFTTHLFNILAPTCFGSSLPSTGSYLDPSELLEIQIEWVVYHIMCGYMAHNYTIYDIPHIRSVFQVTQTDPGSSLIMADYCRNM
jgi:hypothetical protein